MKEDEGLMNTQYLKSEKPHILLLTENKAIASRSVLANLKIKPGIYVLHVEQFLSINLFEEINSTLK